MESGCKSTVLQNNFETNLEDQTELKADKQLLYEETRGQIQLG